LRAVRGLALVSERGVGGWVAVAFAAIFGVGFAGLWLVWVTRGALGSARRVEITDDTVHIGGIAHVFRSDRHTLEGARIRREPAPPVLELVVSWPTRGGKVTEEIRVPIPADRVDEAEALARDLIG
jgi:hypothetical protein